MKKYIYTFSGKILPERIPISFPRIESKEICKYESQNKTIGSVSFEVTSNVLVAVVISNKKTNLATMKNSIERFVQGIINGYGYYTGQAFDVDINIASGPDGTFEFFPRYKSVYNNQNERPVDIDRVIKLSATNIHLMGALNNLREAIKNPSDIGLYCYRSIESIRQFFSKKNQTQNDSWKKMHDVLNSTRSYLTDGFDLTKYSEQSRHGETHSLSEVEISHMMSVVWKMIDRFIIYLDNGERPLDKLQYPLL